MAKASAEAKEQAMAFLCSLTMDRGPNPGLEVARQYAKKEYTAVTPEKVIEILGLDCWEDVLRFYQSYIGGGVPVSDPTGKKSRRAYRRYTREELLEILKELYEEFDGKITQSKVSARAKVKPTPTYATLVNQLGPAQGWGKLLGFEQPDSEQPEPENPDHPDPEPVSIQTILELKIMVPGMSDPVVLEFALK